MNFSKSDKLEVLNKKTDGLKSSINFEGRI